MNSKWYESELESYKKSRETAKKGTPKSIIGITIFFVAIAAIMVYVYTNNPDYQIGPSLGFVGGMYVFILLIILLTQKAANNKSKNLSLDDLQKHLNRILTTPEKLEQFDREMFAEPVKYLIRTTNEEMYITEHYFVNKSILMGGPVYSVAGLDEIVSMKKSGVKDNSKVSPFAREYFVDLLNAEGKKVVGLTIKGKNALMDLKETLNIEED